MADVILGPAVDTFVRQLVGPVINQIQYDNKKEPTNEIRNLILVVVTLIAAVTFQAGINPPGGLWQDNKNGVNGHVAGSAILAYQKQAVYYLFLSFNTLAFLTSTLIILVFTQAFPFSLEIRLAIFSVMVTYVCAVSAITPPESANLAYVLFVPSLPIVVLSLIRRFVRRTQGEQENDSEKDTTDDVAGDVV